MAPPKTVRSDGVTQGLAPETKAPGVETPLDMEKAIQQRFELMYNSSRYASLLVRV